MQSWATQVEDPRVVSIHAIGGMAGIGKTTFAVHVAHLLAEDFPNGQFFLPLHGHTPGHQPVSPADGLASLLLTAGVSAHQIPPGIDARAAQWRDYVAGKKILLLLDDATGHEQVRPLLPGTPQSLVLITSRRRLAALEDAEVVSLDALAPAEASALLAGLAARQGLSADSPPVGQIAALCGYLPLAIGMVGRQLAHHPAWSPEGFARELAGARDRLGLMEAENMSVAAAFDLSYQDLGGAERLLFRRLGLQPGPDIDANAAAALDDISPDEARRRLENLYDEHLITQPAFGRYRFHDLLREHARTVANSDPADARAATARLLDYYRDTALAAAGNIAARVLGSRRMPPAEPPLCAPPVSDSVRATQWFEDERANLHAAVDYAAANGYPEHTAQIANALAGFMFTRGYWDEVIVLQRIALAAARRVGDLASQAAALIQMCLAQALIWDLPAAIESNRRASALYSELGDRRGQGDAMHSLSLLHQMADDMSAAVGSAEQALALYREASDRLGQADALNQLGAVQALADDPAAFGAAQQALELSRELSDKMGEAAALDTLGRTQLTIGSYAAAAASFRRSLQIFRKIGERQGEAVCLARLSWTQRLTGDSAAAYANQQDAFKLFSDLADWGNAAICLTELGIQQQAAGDYPAGIASHQQALQWFQKVGDRTGQAVALGNLGALHTASGDYPSAATSLSQALQQFRDIGSSSGEAKVLNDLGELFSRSLTSLPARDHHFRALAMSRELGLPLEEARALEGVGNSYLSEQDPSQAAEPLRKALSIYQRIGVPGAQRVRQTLDEHGL